MRRRAVVQQVGEHRLVGTLHDPMSGRGAQAPRFPGCVGLLLFNFGQQPRAWRGDLAVHLSDGVAKAGYPVFRFDMPGLGDTEGELPTYVEQLWRQLQEGAHAGVGKALAEAVVREYALDGIVLGGHCGGSVTAVLSTDPRGSVVRGLALLEPELALTQLPQAEGPDVAAVEERTIRERLELAARRLKSTEAWRKLIRREVDLGYYRTVVRDAAAMWWQRWRRGKAPPPDANLPLLRRWSQLADAGLPFIVITAASPQRRAFDRDYAEWTRFGTASNVQWVELENTTHTLISGGAKQGIADAIGAFMRARFSGCSTSSQEGEQPAPVEKPTGAGSTQGADHGTTSA